MAWDGGGTQVKPKPKNESQGYLQLGVELYGGGIWCVHGLVAGEMPGGRYR